MVSIRADGNTVGMIQFRLRGRTTVAAVTSESTSTRHGGDDTVRPNAPYPIIPSIGYIYAVVRADSDAFWAPQLCIRGRPAVAAVILGSDTRHRGDDAVRPNAPDAVVPVIGYKYAAVRSDGNTVGII